MMKGVIWDKVFLIYLLMWL